jgi:hypothetical protein
LTGWLGRYASHPDPLTASGNLVALVLAWNQPFYPIYLWWIAGPKAWAVWPDVLSTLFFLAIPVVSRRHAVAARVLLVLFGVANVEVVWWMLGEASAVWLLLFPCGMLAAMLFTGRERWLMLTLALLPCAVWLATRGRFEAPLVVFTPAETASVATMNTVSAFALLGFFGWVFLRPSASA